MIQDILGRHGYELDETLIKFCTEKLHLPQEWLLDARALSCRAAFDYVKEADILITVGRWDEAHQTIISNIAPHAIIKGQFADLRRLLDTFSDKRVLNWASGGQVYLDYLDLLRPSSQRDTFKPKFHSTRYAENVIIQRLSRNLSNMKARTFHQHVAITEMSSFVSSLLASSEAGVSVILVLIFPQLLMPCID